MKLPLALGLVLFGVWLLWSGHYTDPLLVTLGAVSTVLVVAIGIRMGVVDEESVPLGLPARAFGFFPWMAWQIVTANLHVARRILNPRMPIHPTLVRVKASQRDALGRVIYANCITLTPGTVSVDLVGDEIVVHALTREAAEGLETGEMDRRVDRFAGKR